MTEAAPDGRVERARRLREARRAQILEAARRVFADRGFHGASIQDVLGEAGIARRTFYQYFESKEAAFAEVLQEFLGRLAGCLKPVDLGSPEAATDQLRGNVTRALALLFADHDLSRLLFHHAAGVSDELRAHMDRFYSGVAALIMRSLSTGTRLEMVRPGDLELRATFIVGAVTEAARQILGGGTTPRSAEELAAEIVDFALHGVLK